MKFAYRDQRVKLLFGFLFWAPFFRFWSGPETPGKRMVPQHLSISVR
jgi:hypothetical protein